MYSSMAKGTYRAEATLKSEPIALAIVELCEVELHRVEGAAAKPTS